MPAGLGSPFFPLSPSFVCSAEVQKCGGGGLKAQTLKGDATSHPALEPSLVPYQHHLRQGALFALGWCGLIVVMPWAKCYVHTGTTCQGHTGNRAYGSLGCWSPGSSLACLLPVLTPLWTVCVLSSHHKNALSPSCDNLCCLQPCQMSPVSLRYCCPSWMHRRGLLGH